MRKQGLVVMGIALIVLGVLGVLGSLLDIRWGNWFWPLALIGLGAWMILRPRMLPEGVTVTQKVLGDVRREGAWQVVNEEIAVVLGDVRLDMSQADLRDGVTSIAVKHLLGDTKLKLPEDVGLDLTVNELIADVKVFGAKHEGFATPVHVVSEGYELAQKKVKLQVDCLLGDVRVERV
jgi:predicted membrane protein